MTTPKETRMLTDEQITVLRAKHVPTTYLPSAPSLEDCRECEEPFPCPVVQALDELDAARVAMALAEVAGRATITELNGVLAENEHLKVDQQRWIDWKAVRDETEDDLTASLLTLTQANRRLVAELAQRAPGWESPAVLQEAHNASLASEEDKERRLDAIHTLSTGPLPMAVMYQIAELASWRPSTPEPADETAYLTASPANAVRLAESVARLDAGEGVEREPICGDVSYLELRPLGDGQMVYRTHQVTDHLLVDVDVDGQLIGVESLRGPVEREDLVRVLEDVTLSDSVGASDAKAFGSIVDDGEATP